MRTLARLAVVTAAAVAMFTIPAVAARLDASPTPGPTPVPSPYGYPSEVRR